MKTLEQPGAFLDGATAETSASIAPMPLYQGTKPTRYGAALRGMTAVLLLLGMTVSGQRSPEGFSRMMSSEVAETSSIQQVLMAYQDALNRGDTEASLRLYADDAVVMTPNHETLVGKTAIRAAYEAGAKMIHFKVRFEVKQVVQMSPTWAYARTTSSGTTTVTSSGAVNREANQEVFILKKNEAGRWLITVYSFSSTNGPGT